MSAGGPGPAGRAASISGTDYSTEGAPGPSQLGTGEEARFDPPTQNELWVVQPKENSSPEAGQRSSMQRAAYLPGPQLGASLMVPQGPSAVAKDLGALLRRKLALSAVERANLCRRFHPAGAQWR
jgi:hypothetical protein